MRLPLLVALLLPLAANAERIVRATLDSWGPYDCGGTSLWHAARSAYSYGIQLTDVVCEDGLLANTFALVAMRTVVPDEVVYGMEHPLDFAERTEANRYTALCRLVDAAATPESCRRHGRAQRVGTWCALTRFVLREMNALPPSVRRKVEKVGGKSSKKMPRDVSPEDLRFVETHFPTK